MIWEYHTITIDARRRREGLFPVAPELGMAPVSLPFLDDLGAQGWELTAVMLDPTGAHQLIAFFKRPSPAFVAASEDAAHPARGKGAGKARGEAAAPPDEPPKDEQP